MLIYLLLIVVILIFLIFKTSNLKSSKNNSISRFKKKFLNKESKIKKFFIREDEKTSSNPNININIGLYEDEENIKRKSSIHRARLSKFKKSMLNGEMIYVDKKKGFFKFENGKKLYL